MGSVGRFDAACGCGRRAFVLGALAAALPKGGAFAATDAKPRMIDVHHHAIPEFWFTAAEQDIAAQVGGRIGPQWRGWTPEKSLESMDARQIEMALLSISSPGVWLRGGQGARDLTRRCNEYLAGVVRGRPDRFGFHAALALPDVEGSLREVEYAMDVLKADGVGLLTSYAGKYLGDPSFTPVFEALNARKAVIFVHPTAPACCTTLMPSVSPNFVEFLHDTNRTVLNLMFSGTLRRFPDLSFIFCHAGGGLPMMAGRIGGLVANYPDAATNAPNGFLPEYRKLYFDVSNSTNRAAFGAMAELVPMSQVLVGTDYPVIPLDATLTGFDRLTLTPEDRLAIARANALRLYPSLRARLRS